MNVWSQVARLGAVVAAFGPPILTEAEEEPERVDIPTIDAGNQPVASASITAPVLDPDQNLLEDMAPVAKQYVAAVPAAIQMPPAAEDGTPGPPRTRPKGGARPHVDAKPYGKPWHGSGQRYG